MSFLPDWTFSQYSAIGRHVISYCAGAISMGATWGIYSQVTAVGTVNDLNLLAHGLGEVVTALSALAATAGSVWATIRGIKNASPKEQIKSVVSNLQATQVVQAANAIADPGGRNKLINAVAEMPEVKILQATEAVALQTPSSKVVSELPKPNGIARE